MKKIISYLTLLILNAFVLIGSSALYPITDSYRYLIRFFLISMGFFIAAYLGAYVSFKYWPNDALNKITNFHLFIKYAFGIQLVMGIIAGISAIYQHSLRSQMPEYYQGIDENIGLKMMVILTLVAPFIVRKFIILTNNATKDN